MRIEIEKKDLLNLIGRTINIVEKRNSMPVLVNVLLEAKDGFLRVFATDLEVSLTDQVKAQVHQSGSVAVSAKSLFEISKELSDAPIQLVKKENNWLEIKQGKYLSKIVGINAEEYPIFPTHTNASFAQIEGHVLKDMIDKTIFSVSTDESRYHLNGVYFEHKTEGELGRFIMVATDGHRMSLVNKSTAQMASMTPGQGVIIPRKGLLEIRKLLDAMDGLFEVAVEGAQLIVRHGWTTLMIRLIEGKYPNYQQFIPQKLKQRIQINREAFLTSLKRVSLLSNHKSKAVTINFSAGRMEISSNNPELGDAKEELEIDYHGSDLKVGFNARYITDVLSSMNDDDVDFELNDQVSPGLMKPHNDAEYTCVVMPMRI